MSAASTQQIQDPRRNRNHADQQQDFVSSKVEIAPQIRIEDQKQQKVNVPKPPVPAKKAVAQTEISKSEQTAQQVRAQPSANLGTGHLVGPETDESEQETEEEREERKAGQIAKDQKILQQQFIKAAQLNDSK